MVYSGVPGSTGAALSDPNKEKEEESEGVLGAREDGIVHSKAAPANSVGIVSENGRSTHLVRVSTPYPQKHHDMGLLDSFIM